MLSGSLQKYGFSFFSSVLSELVLSLLVLLLLPPLESGSVGAAICTPGANNKANALGFATSSPTFSCSFAWREIEAATAAEGGITGAEVDVDEVVVVVTAVVEAIGAGARKWAAVAALLMPVPAAADRPTAPPNLAAIICTLLSFLTPLPLSPLILALGEEDFAKRVEVALGATTFTGVLWYPMLPLQLMGLLMDFFFVALLMMLLRFDADTGVEADDVFLVAER
jgi:hypothetical protein